MTSGPHFWANSRPHPHQTEAHLPQPGCPGDPFSSHVTMGSRTSSKSSQMPNSPKIPSCVFMECRAWSLNAIPNKGTSDGKANGRSSLPPPPSMAEGGDKQQVPSQAGPCGVFSAT